MCSHILLLSIYGLPGADISTAVAMFIGNGLIMNWYFAEKVGLDILRFRKKIVHIALPALEARGIAGFVYFLAPYEHGNVFFLLVGCFLYGCLISSSNGRLV